MRPLKDARFLPRTMSRDLKSPFFLNSPIPMEECVKLVLSILFTWKERTGIDPPVEKLAKTTQQVAQAIKDRVALFLDAESHRMNIQENGTIFWLDRPVIFNKDKSFSIGGNLVTYKGAPLLFSSLQSESILIFKKLDNGHTQLLDSIDHRKGKGIFIDLDGKVYRA